MIRRQSTTTSNKQMQQAGRRLVRSLLRLSVFVVDVMDLRIGNRNEDDSYNNYCERTRVRDTVSTRYLEMFSSVSTKIGSP